MIRLVASTVVNFLAGAVALVIAAVLLEDMGLSVGGFLLAAVIFTGVMVLVQPLVRQIAIKNAPALLGSSALVATLVSLVVTTVISDALTIRGATTWVLATVAVWALALVLRLVLPLVIFKQVLAEARDRRR